MFSGVMRRDFSPDSASGRIKEVSPLILMILFRLALAGAEALAKNGLKIWYDEFELTVGDSLRRSIDKGLSRSRFGIVCLSPSFFAKNWPQYELDGLVAKEMTGGKVILPLWHKISKNEVVRYSPTLADRVALKTAIYTIEELADELAKPIRDA